MSAKKITFKIFIFNSETDYLPAYVSYELLVEPSEVILDVLNRIKWDRDGTLSYRRSCRHGICGSCGVKVNEKTILACKQNIFELVEIFGDELTIEPQSIKRAVKDLIVDKKDFWDKYDSVKPYLVAEIDETPVVENIVSPKDAELIDEADYCIQCGCCYYACGSLSVNEDFIGPAALTKAYRFTSDVRDSAKKERLGLVNEPKSGIWDCVKCFECAQACPKGVNPILKITKLHTMSFKEGVAGTWQSHRRAVRLYRLHPARRHLAPARRQPVGKSHVQRPR